MQLRVLGTHNYESRDTRMAGYLIDDVLALDAGSLTRALTFEEQSRIRAVVLSHRHFDHTRDLVPFGLSAWEHGFAVDIYGIRDTIDFVTSTLLNTGHCPDYTKVPSPDDPVFRFHRVGFYEEFEVLDYKATALPVPHAVPAAGFQVVSNDTRLFYTGDTGRGLTDAWKHTAPDVLLTEVTYGNDNEGLADEIGHLTPRMLSDTLEVFKEENGFLPIVVVSHMNPPWERAVREEIKEVSNRFGIEIIISEPDQIIRL